jgi:hypothetical protein
MDYGIEENIGFGLGLMLEFGGVLSGLKLNNSLHYLLFKILRDCAAWFLSGRIGALWS